MLRYALYTRKSNEKREVTEKSTGEQLEQCRPLARQIGLVAREFEESKSAQRPGVRPLFDDMLRLVRRGEVNALFCWKVDRLARNMQEGGALVQLLVDGALLEIRTPFECYRPGDNVLPLTMQMASSTQYSRDLKTNVERGLAGHFAAGGWNGRAPQGYRNARDAINPKVGRVVPDEERFTLIRKGWDLMLTGAYGPARAARVLNEEFGFRTRPTAEGGGTPLSRAQAYKLFANPFYAGFTWYMGKLHRGLHAPMVTEAEFRRVQGLLREGERATRPRNHTQEFAYGGLMRCGLCGSQVTAEHHSIKARGGTRRPHAFYRCADSKGTCTKRGLPERAVEAAVLEAIGGLTIAPELCAIAEECLLRAVGRQASDAAAVASQQQAASADVERRRGRLLEMWVRGLLTDEGRYKEMEAELDAEKRGLTMQASESDGELSRMRENVRQSCRFLRLAPAHFAGSDARRKREIAGALASGYVFFGPGRRVAVTVKPLLAEMVRYAGGVAEAMTGLRAAETRQKPGAFEPELSGSGSSKSVYKLEGVLSGRAEETTFEPDCPEETEATGDTGIRVQPAEALLALLRDGLFPALGFEAVPSAQRGGTMNLSDFNIGA